jgi:hypothetical protein
MINKLIEKYKEKIEYYSKLDSVNCNIRADLYTQILQDLEELKEHQLETLNQTKKYLNSQKATQEMIAMAIRKIEISILGVDRDE